ncbi:MAG: YncE family protein [Bacteroidetes bacterium]|nr:YncE family protein [Bacteroidota bacterium]MBU1580498.1 YncE family protein [Bacteroidota bacterium]MBU2465474.1 YncE family protein [Bacteroidota bacterium]MBU2556443.1 YncE family protein [Bacteroidota bacterium]
MKKLSYLFFLSIIVLSACTKLDDDEPLIPPHNQLGDGFFVLNQGNFTSGNASLSFFEEGSGTMTNNLFFKKNGAPLGDVAQSITFWKEEAFLVVNNSAYIYVIDSKTGLYKRKIAELESPRYLQIVNADKAYVSDFQLKGIFVFNPITMQPQGVIETGKSTEAMVMVDYEVFVTNWSAYNQSTANNTVQVIDVAVDALVDSIVVGKEPNSIVVDQNKKLWVLCSGGYLNEEIPSLIRIDPASRTIEKRYNFSTIESAPEQLKINAAGNTLYYLNDGIYTMDIADAELPASPLISSEGRNFFALGLHPYEQTILASDAGNYVQNGWVYRFKTDGMLVDSLQSGIIPGHFGFNY